MNKKGLLISPYFKYRSCIFRIKARKDRPILGNAMKRVIEQIEVLISHYARGNFLFFNLHGGPDEKCSAVVSGFMRELKRYLASSYSERRVMHVWGRERKTAPTPHYHVLIGVDGSKLSNWRKLKRVISELWSGASSGGSVYFPENGYYLTHREDYVVISELIERASYIVKLGTKENNPTYSRNYSCSRIEKNPDKTGFDFGI